MATAQWDKIRQDPRRLHTYGRTDTLGRTWECEILQRPLHRQVSPPPPKRSVACVIRCYYGPSFWAREHLSNRYQTRHRQENIIIFSLGSSPRYKLYAPCNFDSSRNSHEFHIGYRSRVLITTDIDKTDKAVIARPKGTFIEEERAA